MAACRVLGLAFKAFVLDKPVTRAEAVKLKLTLNCLRRAMTLKQIGSDAAAYMELASCTQAEAAKQLNLSEATISRALSLKLLDPDLLASLEKAAVPYSFIAKLPPLSKPRQEQAAAFLLAGRRTREQLDRHIESTKTKNGRPPKGFVVASEGFKAAINPPDGATTEAIIRWLSGVVAKLKENKQIPPDGLRYLFE